jgi:hypothetical protein
MKTQEDDGDNPTAKFTEPEVDRLLTFASKVEWRRGPDTSGDSNDLFRATWIGYFRGKPTFKAEIQNGATEPFIRNFASILSVRLDRLFCLYGVL